MDARRREPTPVPTSAELQHILGETGVKELVIWAERIGEGLAQNERLTTAQVRGFFGTVRQIQAEVEADAALGARAGEHIDPQREMRTATARKLRLLIPKLAYQARREQDNNKGDGVLRLKQIIVPAIEFVDADVPRFRRFVEFFEAILAYHKANGGRDS
jgi:CRISPR-associated protein Csm2